VPRNRRSPAIHRHRPRPCVQQNPRPTSHALVPKVIARIPKPEPLAPINAEPIHHAASADLKPTVLGAKEGTQEHIKVVVPKASPVAVNLVEIIPIKAVPRGVLKVAPVATSVASPAISIVPKVASPTPASNIKHAAQRTHGDLRMT